MLRDLTLPRTIFSGRPARFHPLIGPALALLTACAPPPAGSGADAAPRVTLVTVAPVALAERLVVPASLRAAAQVALAAKRAGTVETVNVDDGAAVRRGDLLATIDGARQEARLREATAVAALAASEYGRAATLVAQGVEPPQALERARAQRDAAEAARAIARADWLDSRIVAPFAGTLGARRVDPGQYVAAGTNVFDLVDADPIEAEGFAPEDAAAALRPGALATLRTAAAGDSRAGTVVFVAPALDEQTRTLAFKARFDNRNGLLRPGMSAELTVTLGQRQVLAVPEAALQMESGRNRVWLIAGDGNAERRDVDTGMRADGWVEVRAGLQAGDRVVRDGVQKVRSGKPVAAVAPAATTSP